MGKDNGMKSRKKICLFAIGAVIAAAVMAEAGKGIGKGGGDAERGKGMPQETEAEAQGQKGEQEGQEEEGMQEESGTIVAMYIPFGDGRHIFAGEQSGLFEVTFPDEIYDIHGNKIEKGQLAKGNIVKIYGNGIMMQSYPGQYHGVTKMEVIEEGKPSDADPYQRIVDEIYQEPDPAQPPALNVEYTTDSMVATVMINRGGYEWVYTDEDGLSNAVVADSLHVLDWKAGEMLADIKTQGPLELTLLFSVEPQEVQAVRYDASFLGKSGETPEGENVAVEKKDGKLVLGGVEAGYVYDITGIWENGRANYGFLTLKEVKAIGEK